MVDASQGAKCREGGFRARHTSLVAATRAKEHMRAVRGCKGQAHCCLDSRQDQMGCMHSDQAVDAALPLPRSADASPEPSSELARSRKRA